MQMTFDSTDIENDESSTFYFAEAGYDNPTPSKNVKLTPEKRQKMEKLIYDFFSAFDKSGTNTRKYKEMFEDMSDAQFNKWFQGFFEDENAYLVLDIVDYEHTIVMDDIERAAKVLKIPLFEYVYMPHLTMDKSNVIRTPEPVPVGYLHTKRTQQTVNSEIFSIFIHLIFIKK